MTIEVGFDIAFVAALALKEKQIQQNYRPIIAVHKWFARRPGSLFRALTLAEFRDCALKDSYFQSNDFPGRKVADPFMGGGTPLIEANRVGCDVFGFDINPMSAWIVREEMDGIDLPTYRATADKLIGALRADIDDAYVTDCPLHGDHDVPVKYFLWVKITDCAQCKNQIDLFPGYMIADDTRHPRHVLVCPDCGDLNEVEYPKSTNHCRTCKTTLRLTGPARRNRCVCKVCGHTNGFPRAEAGTPQHRMFAIEYYNPHRRDQHRGRFFKKPDARDLARYKSATARWNAMTPAFAPDDEIPAGDESSRLHRWGYRRYSDMFNDRQLLGLESSCKLIMAIPDLRVPNSLINASSAMTSRCSGTAALSVVGPKRAA